MAVKPALELHNTAIKRTDIPVLRYAQTLAVPPGRINAVPLDRCRGEGILVFSMEERVVERRWCRLVDPRESPRTWNGEETGKKENHRSPAVEEPCRDPLDGSLIPVDLAMSLPIMSADTRDTQYAHEG